MTAANAPNVTPYAQIALRSDELGQFSLFGPAGFICPEGGGTHSSLFGSPIATGVQSQYARPEEREANDALKDDPALKTPSRIAAASGTAAAGKPKRLHQRGYSGGVHPRNRARRDRGLLTRLYDTDLLKPAASPVRCSACSARLRRRASALGGGRTRG